MSPARIVHVEDDDVDAEMFATACRHAGVPPPAVRLRDGDAAVRWLQAAPAGESLLVLLDLGLPKKDGFQVLSEIAGKDASRDLFVIALSGHVDSLDRLRHDHPGIMAFAKPFTLEDYESLVAAIGALTAALPAPKHPPRPPP